jgi:methionyl-tRNA formyltransferase
MQMDPGLDTGDILLQRSTPIGKNETSIELMSRLGVMGADLISEALSQIDTLKPIKQNDADATLAPIMKKEDGLIDWHRTAAEFERRVRGFQPFPSSYTFHNGLRLTIRQAETIDASDRQPGEIIEATGDRLIVGCGHSTALRITEIQPEGKRRMPVRDFLNGSKIEIGNIFGSSPTK